MSRADLRSRIGMVLQDTWLFKGTIRDNIAYGRPDASEAEILEAAKATFVDRFVRSLPAGYDTVIGVRGNKLQLVLNTVYGIGAGQGTIPYTYYERLPETLAGLHFVAFACLMLQRLCLTLGPLQVHNSL